MPDKAARSESDSNLKLFLSHSTQDKQLVGLILNLIKAALPIADTAIRCTSFAGHRLRSGTNIDEQLRNELRAALAFVGVITPNSLSSIYVLFELGARWGGGHHFIPLTCLPSSQIRLPGPMAGLHFLRSQRREDIEQFVDELAALLGQEAPAPARYADELESLLVFAKASADASPSVEAKPSV